MKKVSCHYETPTEERAAYKFADFVESWHQRVEPSIEKLAELLDLLPRGVKNLRGQHWGDCARKHNERLANVMRVMMCLGFSVTIKVKSPDGHETEYALRRDEQDESD